MVSRINIPFLKSHYQYIQFKLQTEKCISSASFTTYLVLKQIFDNYFFDIRHHVKHSKHNPIYADVSQGSEHH